MTIQLSVTARNARLDAIETIAGTSAVLRIFTGAQPADCNTASSGTCLAAIVLASDWSAAAANGTKAFSNLPLTTTALTSGAAGYYRLQVNGASNATGSSSTAIMQGSIGQGSGDLQLDNTSIQASQTINITAWTITDGNA
jgi:hypothetical protein